MITFANGQWFLDIGWFIFLLGLLGYFLRTRKIFLQAQSWLKVKGRISQCEWIKVGHNFWPKIQYEYQVYEQDLVGEHLFLDTFYNNPNSKYSRLVAYKAVLAFKEHALIDIYYNPNHPEQSVLDVRMPLKLNIILLALGFLILVHLGLVIFRVFA